ncbi:MAG: hypothetical protein ACREBT_04010 [Thermoplasmata archaeon]
MSQRRLEVTPESVEPPAELRSAELEVPAPPPEPGPALPVDPAPVADSATLLHARRARWEEERRRHDRSLEPPVTSR